MRNLTIPLMSSCLAPCLALCLAISLSLSPCATAQEGTASILPKNPLAVFEMDGPAALAARFGGTNLGQLIKSPMIQGMLEQAKTSFLEEAGDERESAEKLMGMLLGYGGRLRVGGGFFDVAAPDKGGYLMLQWFEDKDSDFDAWLEFMNEKIEAEGEEDKLHDVEAGDMEFRTLSEDRFMMTLPTKYGKSLVQIMVIGPDGDEFEEQLANLVTGGDRYESPAEASKTAVFMKGNLEPLLKMVADMADEMAEYDDRAAMASTLLEAIGINTFRSMQMTIAPAGKHMVLESSLQLSEGPSFLDIIRPESKDRPALLRYIPRDSQNWSISPFRFGKIYDLVGTVMTAMEAPMSLDDIEGMMVEATGVELKSDLLDYLGNELLTIQDVIEADDLDSPVAGMCLGFPMKDGPAFDKSIETILRSRGLHVARKVKEYRDHKVKSLSIVGPTIYWAVLDEVVLVGVDSTGLASLHKVIDSVIDVRAGKELADFGDAVRNRMEHAPQQWQGCGYTDVGAMISSIAMIAESEASVPIPDGILPMIEGVLKQYDLNLFLSTVSDEGSVIRSRMIW